jgi:sugar/nucleoside kinase (ribokinase family)
VLVVGEVMTDIIVRPTGPLVVGSDRRASILARPGGSGANQAVWLAAAGLAVRFAARVAATDRDRLTAQFAQAGVEARLGGDPERPSGTLVTIVAPDGERSFLTDKGANAALSAEDLPATLLDDCRMLVVSGYSLFEPTPRMAVIALLRAALARGVPVAVDPASVGFLEEVGPADFLGWTAGATMIFANDAEAAALTGLVESDGQVRALGASYGRVVIKRGAAGAVLGDRSGILCSRPAPAVAVVDSTGAGDAFAAAFIAVELSGAAVEAALQQAILAGADAVTRLGGRPGA